MLEMITTFQLDIPVAKNETDITPPPGFELARKRVSSSSRLYEIKRAETHSGGSKDLTDEIANIIQPPFAQESNVEFLHKLTYSQSFPIRTFHLAEGPGGFIEAICNKRANPFDEYHGMTILVDEMDDNVPGWNKTGYFLEQHPNVHIETGADGTGDLLHIANFDHCIEKYASSMDLVTADGGFDFSKDFNKQELSIMHLLWGQVCYALCLQKMGGNFVLKLFDIFYDHTIDILYILSGFYNEVNVCKLQTSRIGNSEKYVVCKGFRYETCREFLPIIRDSFEQISQTRSVPDTDSGRFHKRTGGDNLRVWRILNIPVPRHFTKQIEDINAMFGQQQIENIHYTISIIDKHTKHDKTEQLTKQNISKCVNWCIEHKVPYNNITTTNIFIGQENASL
jgi:23S rRNA U2552 (ribose-2'-O)-methylase RlmE/FtsJ